MIQEKGRTTWRQKGQREHCRGDGKVREHRPRKRLVDRAVQHLTQRLLPLLLEVLAYAIEDDDRIVERVPDHREEGRHDRERDLQAHDRQEGEGAQQIMSGREHRSHAEAPLEADRKVDQRDEQRDEDPITAFRLNSSPTRGPTNSVRTTRMFDVPNWRSSDPWIALAVLSAGADGSWPAARTVYSRALPNC